MSYHFHTSLASILEQASFPSFQNSTESNIPKLLSLSGKLEYFLTGSPLALIFFLSLVILMVYYAIVLRSNRFSMLGTNTPIKEPPYALSPAAMRYISEMGFDTKCLVIGIINAGIKGCYKIRWGSKGFLALQTRYADFKQLSLDEKSALTFNKKEYWKKILVKTEFSFKTRKMSSRMENVLKKKYSKLFNKRFGWVIGGMLFSVLACSFIFLQSEGYNTLPMLYVYLATVLLFVAAPIYSLQVSIRDRYAYGILTGILYLAAGIFAIIMIEKSTIGPLFTPVVLPFLVVNYAFYLMLPTYTSYGRKVMKDILAYKIHLKEKFTSNNGQVLNAEMLMELPYLMALDMDCAYTPYFETVLSRTKYGPHQIFDRIYQ